MTEKKYPEEIYPKRKTEKTAFGFMESWHSSNLDYERAYDLGFRDGRFKERLEASNPLAGWSNLTYAIQAGERIDWEKLDGLEAKCVHPELGVLTYKLERDGNFPPAKYSAWYKTGCPVIWLEALIKSWLGLGGWSLWIKGELPIRKLTADQLEPGTCFLDIKGNSHIVYITPRGEKVAYARYGSHDKDPKYVYVGKVLGVGTFQTPEGDA